MNNFIFLNYKFSSLSCSGYVTLKICRSGYETIGNLMSKFFKNQCCFAILLVMDAELFKPKVAYHFHLEYCFQFHNAFQLVHHI